MKKNDEHLPKNIFHVYSLLPTLEERSTKIEARYIALKWSCSFINIPFGKYLRKVFSRKIFMINAKWSVINFRKGGRKEWFFMDNNVWKKTWDHFSQKDIF